MRGDLKNEERVSKLVSDLHAPIMTRPQTAINVLKDLPRHHRSFFPRCVRVRQLLPILIDVDRVVVDVEIITRHTGKIAMET